ncbi:MAG TPA: hypothetical protein VNA14_11060 [Mycobacteriales bacterium]|nr:hypothetical protein [Mycobacteriales bacterium]
MRTTLLLGDFARVAEGKLDIIGGGWTYTGPDPVTMGLGIIVEVPWDQANSTHELHLSLLGADGQLVEILGGEEPQTIQLATQFEVGRPAGQAAGTPIPFPLAVNVNAVPLPAGERFEWRLEINGETHEDWSVRFQTRPRPLAANSPTSF